MQCERCRSYAINPGQNGRGDGAGIRQYVLPGINFKDAWIGGAKSALCRIGTPFIVGNTHRSKKSHP